MSTKDLARTLAAAMLLAALPAAAFAKPVTAPRSHAPSPRTHAPHSSKDPGKH